MFTTPLGILSDSLKGSSLPDRKRIPNKDAVRFVKKYHEGIVDKWPTFFVKNKKVKCEVITQKV